MRIVEDVGLTVVCLLVASCSGASMAPADEPSLGEQDASDEASVPTGAGGGDTAVEPDGGFAAMDASHAASDTGHAPMDAAPAAKDQGLPEATTPPRPADPCVAGGTCPPNTWINVTPKGITIPMPGLRAVVVDRARPTDLYMGAGTDAGLWKSTDYGNTWKMIGPGFGYIPQGLDVAIAPTTPATIYIAAYDTSGHVHKSTDGGATFRTTGGGLPTSLYSFEVDPYNTNHLISGFHEQSGIAESTDAGETWHVVGTTGFPTGGISWFPQFIDDGVPATTAQSWIAIAQNGGSPTITHDGGKNWTVPTGVQGLTHGHGNAQIFQRGADVFIPGTGGPGDGVYRSTDWGATFTRTSNTVAAVAWGTPNHVYAMWGWSCFGCAIDPKFQIGSKSGDNWTLPGVPTGITMSADTVAVTFDGSHYIFVGAFKSDGVWRYVEQ